MRATLAAFFTVGSAGLADRAWALPGELTREQL